MGMTDRYPSAGAEHFAKTGKTARQTVIDEANLPADVLEWFGLAVNRIQNTEGGRPSDAARTAVHRYRNGTLTKESWEEEGRREREASKARWGF